MAGQSWLIELVRRSLEGAPGSAGEPLVSDLQQSQSNNGLGNDRLLFNDNAKTKGNTTFTRCHLGFWLKLLGAFLCRG